MEVTARYLDGVKFDLAARGHRVLCDQPASNAGTDTGMSPPEFLLASLAACAGYYAVQYLNTRGLDSDGLEVKVVAEKALQPARLGTFRIEVVTGELEERHKEGVLRAVKACLVHNTLLHNPEIHTMVMSPASVSD